MDKNVLAVVLGYSLLMESVGTALQKDLHLNVIRIEASSIDLLARLKSLQPELVVFEMDSPRPCAILSMLREHPGTVFIGIDSESSQAIVLNSNQQSIHNIKEFSQLSHSELTDKTPVCKEEMNRIGCTAESD